MERLTKPELINGFTACYLNTDTHLPTLISKCNPYSNIVEKLKFYEDLDEQGKLLKPPCTVGDTVYTNKSLDFWHLRKEDRPYEAKVDFIGITREGDDNFINVVFTAGQMSQFKFSDIGKTVFLTQEEAENAMKRIENEI